MRKLMIYIIVLFHCCYAMEITEPIQDARTTERDCLAFVHALAYLEEKRSDEQELSRDDLKNMLFGSYLLERGLPRLKQAIKCKEYRKIEKELTHYFETSQQQMTMLTSIITNLSKPSNAHVKESMCQQCEKPLQDFFDNNFFDSNTMTNHWKYLRISLLRDLQQRVKQNNWDKRMANFVDQSGPVCAGAGMGASALGLFAGITTWPAIALALASGGCCVVMQSDCYDRMRPKRYWYKKDQDKICKEIDGYIQLHQLFVIKN